jgi:hypothetical protein
LCVTCAGGARERVDGAEFYFRATGWAVTVAELVRIEDSVSAGLFAIVVCGGGATSRTAVVIVDAVLDGLSHTAGVTGFGRAYEHNRAAAVATDTGLRAVAITEFTILEEPVSAA